MSDRRRNGFSPPYTGAQISAWVALVATFLEFLLFVSPIMPIAASVPVTIFFTFLFAGTVYYGGLTQAVDPMDLHLCQHLKEQMTSESAATSNGHNGSHPDDDNDLCPSVLCSCLPSLPTPLPPPADEPMKQCWICDTQVAEHSMHCKFCNKCVYRFDHHCMWLNTCIGDANYLYFYRCMCFIMAMECSHFFIQLGLVVDSFLGGATAQRQDDWLSEPAINAVLIFFMVFNSVSIFLIGQLLWFHIRLQKENLTTYQYIVRDHKRRRDEARVEVEIQSKRVVAVTKAQREGKPCLAFRLELGGPCRKLGWNSCDPLEIPPELLNEPDPEAGFGASLGGSPSLPQSESPASQEESDDTDSEEERFSDAKEEHEESSTSENQVTFVKVKDTAESESSNESSPADSNDADRQPDEETAAETGNRR